VYIKGEDNTVADALSCLPDTVDDIPTVPVTSMLCVKMDPLRLQSILVGYESDPFCIKLVSGVGSIPGLTIRDKLLYVGDRLVIPRAGTLWEDLFRLTHNNLGHFGFNKSYASLRNAYYWPNMRRDLEEAYIPTCVNCQHNKSHTKKHTGPLYPLPIPDTWRLHCD
jgi:hypothetical protein